MIFAHYQNANNAGDRYCCPADYFPQFADCKRVALDEIPSGDEPVVLGGGGLIFEHNDAWIKALSETRPVIIWGAGLNYPVGEVPNNWYSFLTHCRLVGLRDAGYVRGFEWVDNLLFTPCPSCFEPTFLSAKWRTPIFDSIIYEHVHRPIAEEFKAPSLSNEYRSDRTFADTINFLASAQTIVTNSYHGAYWGLLLGRRVIIYKPINSNRYWSGLPTVPITNELSVVKNYLKSPEGYTIEGDLLSDMRLLTEDFADQLDSL